MTQFYKVTALMIAVLAVSSSDALAFGRSSGGGGSTVPSTHPCSVAPRAQTDGTVRFELSAMNQFTESQKEKLREAAAVAERVINSDEFRDKVINFTYNGEKHFVSTDLSNEQVYDTLLAAKETYTGNTDSVAQLCLNIYTPPFYKKWSVVGYTTPGQPDIYMNSYYFNSFDATEVAGNMVHEWTHKLGFDHDYNRTARRPYSVPYAIGAMVGELADLAH